MTLGHLTFDFGAALPDPSLASSASDSAFAEFARLLREGEVARLGDADFSPTEAHPPAFSGLYTTYQAPLNGSALQNEGNQPLNTSIEPLHRFTPPYTYEDHGYAHFNGGSFAQFNTPNVPPACATNITSQRVLPPGNTLTMDIMPVATSRRSRTPAFGYEDRSFVQPDVLGTILAPPADGASQHIPIPTNTLASNYDAPTPTSAASNGPQFLIDGQTNDELSDTLFTMATGLDLNEEEDSDDDYEEVLVGKLRERRERTEAEKAQRKVTRVLREEKKRKVNEGWASVAAKIDQLKQDFADEIGLSAREIEHLADGPQILKKKRGYSIKDAMISKKFDEVNAGKLRSIIITCHEMLIFFGV